MFFLILIIKLIFSRSFLHWWSLITLSRSYLHWRCLITLSRSSLHWRGLITLSRSSLHWWYLIILSRSSLHWWYLIILSRSSLHWWYLIILSMLKLRLIKINRLSSSVIWLTWTEIRLALSRIISLSVMLLLSIPTNWTIRDWRIIMRWIVYNHGYFIFIFIFRLLIDRDLSYQALSSSISHPSA